MTLDIPFKGRYRKHSVTYDLIRRLGVRTWEGLEMQVPTALVAHRTIKRFEIEKDLQEFINVHVKNSVFWDIGACVGNFSILAAKNNNKVFSFEPDGLTYSILVTNAVNSGQNITTLPIALGEKNNLQTLYMQKFEAANAYNTVGREVQYDGKAFNSENQQTVLEFRADYLISELEVPAPEFIKIDVDGNELLVLKGFGKILDSSDLKGIAIELVGDGIEVQTTRKLLKEKNFKQIYFTKGNLEREANEFYIRIGYSVS